MKYLANIWSLVTGFTFFSMFLKFMHVVALSVLWSLLWLNSVPLHVIPLFVIHLSVDGHLRCFFLLVWTVLLYMGIHVFAWVSTFHSFEHIPVDRMLSHGKSIFNFLRNFRLPSSFLQWLNHLTFPLINVQLLIFSTFSPTLLLFFFLLKL